MYFSHNKAVGILKIPRALESIIREQKIKEKKNEADFHLSCRLKQQAFKGLEILVSHFGQDYPESFSPILSTLVGCLQEDSDSRVIASALTCFGLMCSELKDAVVPHLKFFIPRLLQVCEEIPTNITFPSGNDSEEARSFFQMTALSSLEMLIEGIPHLLVPFFSQILNFILKLSTSKSFLKKVKENKSQEDKDEQQSILKWTERLIESLSRHASARIILNPIITCYKANYNKTAIPDLYLLVVLLQKTFENMEANSLGQVWTENSFKFLLLLLSWRQKLTSSPDETTTEVFETTLSKAFAEFAFKLKEKVFQEFFKQFVIWGTEKITDLPTQTLFFQVIAALTSKLRVLFL